MFEFLPVHNFYNFSDKTIGVEIFEFFFPFRSYQTSEKKNVFLLSYITINEFDYMFP